MSRNERAIRDGRTRDGRGAGTAADAADACWRWRTARLLSTFTVTNTLDDGSAGTPALGDRPGEFDRGRRHDRL